MTASDRPPPGPPPGKSHRPLPVIDLDATEIESKPAAAPDAPQPEASQVHAAAQPEPSVQPDQEPTPAGPAAPEAPDSKSPDWRAGLGDKRPNTSAAASRMPNLPWRSFAAAVAGGLIVLLGLYAFNKDGSPANDSARVFDMRLIRAEQQLRELNDRAPSATDPKVVEELTARLAKIETAVAAIRPSAADPATANRIAIIEGEVKAMAESVSVLGRRNDDIAALAGEARKRADANAAAIDELEKKIAVLGPSPVVRSEFDTLTGRVGAVEQSGKAIEAALAKRPLETDRAGRLAVVAAALKSAVDRGDPFAAELASVTTLAPDNKTLAPLAPFATSGVPTAVMLGRELSLLAPALYQAAGVANRESGGFLERLQANAEKLVRIKPIAEVPGDDPTTVITRIELKAARSDVTGALTDLAKLPAAVRAPADAWIKQAEARAAAVEASRRFAADSMAALGK
jgi:hypothetical protein